MSRPTSSSPKGSLRRSLPCSNAREATSASSIHSTGAIRKTTKTAVNCTSRSRTKFQPLAENSQEAAAASAAAAATTSTMAGKKITKARSDTGASGSMVLHSCARKFPSQVPARPSTAAIGPPQIQDLKKKLSMPVGVAKKVKTEPDLKAVKKAPAAKPTAATAAPRPRATRPSATITASAEADTQSDAQSNRRNSAATVLGRISIDDIRQTRSAATGSLNAQSDIRGRLLSARINASRAPMRLSSRATSSAATSATKSATGSGAKAASKPAGNREPVASKPDVTVDDGVPSPTVASGSLASGASTFRRSGAPTSAASASSVAATRATRLRNTSTVSTAPTKRTRNARMSLQSSPMWNLLGIPPPESRQPREIVNQDLPRGLPAIRNEAIVEPIVNNQVPQPVPNQPEYEEYEGGRYMNWGVPLRSEFRVYRVDPSAAANNDAHLTNGEKNAGSMKNITNVMKSEIEPKSFSSPDLKDFRFESIVYCSFCYQCTNQKDVALSLLSCGHMLCSGCLTEIKLQSSAINCPTCFKPSPDIQDILGLFFVE